MQQVPLFSSIPSFFDIINKDDTTNSIYKKFSNIQNFDKISKLSERRKLERSILETLMIDRDRLVSKTKPDWGQNILCQGNQQLDFPELQRLNFLETLIRGISSLCMDESKELFNIEQLFHLFEGMPTHGGPTDGIDWIRKTVTLAGAGHPVALELLQESYLGYIVKRPLHHAPIGRTVLRWLLLPYTCSRPWITNTSQTYKAHFLGISLDIRGLGWQQQEQTGACASQALWSALQARAYRHYPTPSSPVITILANKFHAAGKRTFPSRGLGSNNLAEAIRHQEGLVPMVISGDLTGVRGSRFSREYFNLLSTAFLFGDFPVLVIGNRKDRDEKHAVCLTGFRAEKLKKSLPLLTNPNDSERKICVCGDLDIEAYFGHDVNIGPNARFTLNDYLEDNKDNIVILSYSEPVSAISSEKIDHFIEYCNENIKNIKDEEYDLIEKINFQFDDSLDFSVPHFVPDSIILALPKELRSEPRHFLDMINGKMWLLTQATRHLAGMHVGDKENAGCFWPYAGKFVALSYVVRYVAVTGYLETGLKRHLPLDPILLADVRKRVMEGVRPMSRHIGILRVGLFLTGERSGDPPIHRPLMDLIFDTTESDVDHPVFAHVKFLSIADDIILTAQRFAGPYIEKG
ncbi:MAG: hypothetical protein HQL63_16180 [Magnetococcales bacterium]|nr:hypothetical protein [Magnetococcales bacterium]